MDGYISGDFCNAINKQKSCTVYTGWFIIEKQDRKCQFLLKILKCHKAFLSTSELGASLDNKSHTKIYRTMNNFDYIQ